jgi:hypothetical protein
MLVGRLDLWAKFIVTVVGKGCSGKVWKHRYAGRELPSMYHSIMWDDSHPCVDPIQSLPGGAV